MQKLGMIQGMQQKLSPQQIQFIKLLQVPTMELESRIEEELEINPALEEGHENEEDEREEDYNSEEDDNKESDDDINLEEYLAHDDFGGYKMAGDRGGDEEERWR